MLSYSYLLIINENIHLIIKESSIDIFYGYFNISPRLCEGFLLEKVKTQKYFFPLSFIDYPAHYLETWF